MDFSQRFEEVIRQHPRYEPRPSQLEMAQFIHDALAEGKHAIVEAGTGSGKSFGYLIPLLEQQGPLIISTGTIALQEQLLTHDLPTLQKTMKPFTYALAKGRAHYICHEKFWEADRLLSAKDPLRTEFDRLCECIEGWDGDVAKLPFVPSAALWAELASDADDCLGARCEHLALCPIRKARKQLAEVDLIVSNHSLYFADFTSNGAILPEHTVVVFDEAHKLPQAATEGFSVVIGRYALTRLLQKIRRRIGIVPDTISFELIGLESRLLNWVWKGEKSHYRLYPDSEFLDIAEGMAENLERLQIWLEEDAPLTLPKADIHRDRLTAQVEGLLQRWSLFDEGDSALMDRVYWVEMDRDRGYFSLHCAPLEVGETMAKSLWPKRQAILTSATLSVDGNFGYFCKQIGLEAPSISIPSPFDFCKQALLYVPRYLPEPNAPEFANYAREAIRDILDKTQGRALVLFTSYRAMFGAYRTLSDKIPFPLRQQGDLPRAQLIEWFKTTPNAVLFATSTFWEGVDIPGDALSCVIIDRIPFSVPDDPVIEAQIERLKMSGKDWFHEFTLPQAIIRLKQGFGRLIRSHQDQGIVAILDNRLFTKYYGKTILRSLPHCPQVRDLEDYYPD